MLSQTTSPSSNFGQFWNGGFFERTALSNLGLCFYLGHQHSSCPLSHKTQTLVVIDDNGIHHVNVQFCACTRDSQWAENYRQLLRVGWYPASFQKPKTAFTFNVLDSYHKLALQGKLNLYDFYSSITQKTDNCGREKMIVSRVFFRIGLLLTFGSSIDITICHGVFASGGI